MNVRPGRDCVGGPGKPGNTQGAREGQPSEGTCSRTRTREAERPRIREAVACLMVAGAALAALALPVDARAAITCARTVTADVVVFDQPLMYNRLGAQNVNGIVYALRRDVVELSCRPDAATGAIGCTTGQPADRRWTGTPGQGRAPPRQAPATARPPRRRRRLPRGPLREPARPDGELHQPARRVLPPAGERPGGEPHGRLPRPGHAVRDRHRRRRLGGRGERLQPRRTRGVDGLHVLRREGGRLPGDQPRRQLRRPGLGREQLGRHVRRDQRRAPRRELLPQPGHRGGDAPGHHGAERRWHARPRLRGDLSLRAGNRRARRHDRRLDPRRQHVRPGRRGPDPARRPVPPERAGAARPARRFRARRRDPRLHDRHGGPDGFTISGHRALPRPPPTPS